MSEALNPKNAPYVVKVTEGKDYYWCSCGKSKSQPFCDGSHQGTTFEPVAFKAEETRMVYLCGCKKTGNAPFCDGSHNK
ncbi:Glutamate synthase [NADPH] large chain [hydrothermal vent metagenome]|uniref:Glutamate synthase [NADPH] large chain n=1 Tax=hydrothermal vent metagenome TaxID=652676 RepID=A0A3B0X7N1_9ZZZZ